MGRCRPMMGSQLTVVCSERRKRGEASLYYGIYGYTGSVQRGGLTESCCGRIGDDGDDGDTTAGQPAHGVSKSWIVVM